MIIARSYADAPEVDGLVYVKTNDYLSPGQIINVKVTGADSYDLVAKL